MLTLFLIRHGESLWNRRGRIQGFMESELSDLGKEQAERVGRRLRGENVTYAVSSTSKRAVDTRKIALASFGGAIPAEESPALREINLGEWEGAKAADLKKRFPGEVEKWFSTPSRVNIKGGEKLAAFRRRVSREINRISGERPEGVIAVFVHGGVICTYLTSLLGMKLDDIWRFKIKNGSITKIIFPRRLPRIELLGDVHHLNGAEGEELLNVFRMFP